MKLLIPFLEYLQRLITIADVTALCWWVMKWTLTIIVGFAALWCMFVLPVLLVECFR